MDDTNKTVTVDSGLTASEPEKEELISLESYLEKNKVNVGLIASFKVEALKDTKMLDAKALADWQKAFKAQSNKTYR